MAVDEVQTRVGRFVENRVDDQTAQIGIAPDSGAGWVAQLCVCLHDTETIGPRMLSRIAKHTGLTPDDL